MATFYFTKRASPSEENSSHPEIFCHTCGLRSIPRPKGATAATRYTCPPCSDLLLKSRDRETADTLAAIGASIDVRCWQETTSAGPLGVTGG
jgi:hypothetical protein